ncbi:MAG: hypothetical protein FWC73_06625 [Defluviitaleaceae bacterium]|nr:hypothetical protein [Defluviitaleaceae bacterium]
MFTPDYQNMVNAAFNRKSDRIPLYEHVINDTFMEKATGKRFIALQDGDYADKLEYFRHYCGFYKDMGYDTISYEGCVGPVMPGSGALMGITDGVIKTREDFEKYPWAEIEDIFFNTYSHRFNVFRESLPQGMKGVGGVGNGIFECVQDIVGFEHLCLIRVDDEELYGDLFAKVGDVLCAIWARFLPEFGDIFCVCRMGDDLGFKSATLLPPDDIRKHIVPQYKRVVDIIHSHNKPFLYHSCGNIFDVMPDIINISGIDAKHSNEDIIAPFSKWIDDYGNKIGNFGGLDTDILCDITDCDIVEYTTHAFSVCAKKGRGVAMGSGNSIPDYVSVDRYCMALETIRKLRGE